MTYIVFYPAKKETQIFRNKARKTFFFFFFFATKKKGLFFCPFSCQHWSTIICERRKKKVDNCFVSTTKKNKTCTTQKRYQCLSVGLSIFVCEGVGVGARGAQEEIYSFFCPLSICPLSKKTNSFFYYQKRRKKTKFTFFTGTRLDFMLM